MNANLSLSYLGLIYILLMAVIFFNQKRINRFENNIYGILILNILFQLVFGILSYYSILSMKTYPFLNLLLNKLYLISLAGWIMLFAMYVVSISVNMDNVEKTKKLKTIFISNYIVMAIIIFLLPLKFVVENNFIYSTGAGTYFTYISASISILVIIVSVILNRKNLKNRKYIPTLLFIALGSIFMVIQMKIPQLFLVSPLEVYITFLMYFTIENPDVKMIEELTKSRQTAKKSVDEKLEFVFLVTEQMKGVMDRVGILCNNSLDNNPNPDIKENILEIKQLVDSSKIRINEMLNVSDKDVLNLKITKNKYDFNLLINEIKFKIKDKMPSGVEFRVNVNNAIPNELYGDSLKIKQVIMTLLENSIKYTKTGFIELRIGNIIKYNVCRLIITVEDSGVGMDSQTINYLLNDNNDLSDEDLQKNTSINLNLKLVKKIVHLSGGVMTIDSVLGTGTSIQLIMDQGMIENTSVGLEKYANEMMQKSKVAIITTDKNISKLMKKQLEKLDFVVEIFDESKSCLDNVRNDIKYDAVIIDEYMPKIPALDLLNKLKAVERFHGKVMVITNSKDFLHKKDLIDRGFTEVIDLPFNKKEFQEKIERIKNN